MSRIVVFNEKGVRIHHADGVKDIQAHIKELGIKPGSYLINPEYPPGVPPHLWKLVDGKIGLEEVLKHKRSLKPFLYILLSLGIALLLKRIL